MSRPDGAPDVAVDFAPPKAIKRTGPMLGLIGAIVLMAAIGVAVTQLLLR